MKSISLLSIIMWLVLTIAVFSHRVGAKPVTQGNNALLVPKVCKNLKVPEKVTVLMVTANCNIIPVELEHKDLPDRKKMWEGIQLKVK